MRLDPGRALLWFRILGRSDLLGVFLRRVGRRWMDGGRFIRRLRWGRYAGAPVSAGPVGGQRSGSTQVGAGSGSSSGPVVARGWSQ